MEAYARAGIDILGRVLRYAEVEQYGTRYRLLRLGSCDFDFDVMQALAGNEAEERLTTISEALADVFSGTVASTLHVTLHPSDSYSFFTPLPSSTDGPSRKVRLQQEAALLAGVSSPLHLTADALYSETVGEDDRFDWVHVLAVREPIHSNFSRILQVLPPPRHRLMASMQAASVVAGRVLRGLPEGHPAAEEHTLTIGWYDTHLEYVVSRGGDWYFSQYAAAPTISDGLYYAVAMLQRLGVAPAHVKRLYFYGTRIDPSAHDLLTSIFGAAPERLNPLDVIDLDRSNLTADFDAEAYVPCVGAAL